MCLLDVKELIIVLLDVESGVGTAGRAANVDEDIVDTAGCAADGDEDIVGTAGCAADVDEDIVDTAGCAASYSVGTLGFVCACGGC